MLTELSSRLNDPPRNRFFWIGIGLVIAAQVVARWMVCTRQVRLAEVRDSEHLMQRLALVDCMQGAGATLAHCMNRTPHLDPGDQPPDDDGPAAASIASRLLPAPPPGGGSLPVSFSR